MELDESGNVKIKDKKKKKEIRIVGRTAEKEFIQPSKKEKKDDEINIYVATEKLKNYIEENGKDENSKLLQVKKLSIKYYYIIQKLLQKENQDQKAFIYIHFVNYGGVLFFTALLQLFGFSHAPLKYEIEQYKQDDTQNYKRFITPTSSTLSSTQISKLVNNVFNHPENKYGKYIRIIIGSDIIGEGISFKHIRNAFIVTPKWNNPGLEQVIARAIRATSHLDLLPQEQNINIYRLVADTPKDPTNIIKSIDLQMYKVSEDKDIKIKQIERLMKESAVDCMLNKKRNVNLKKDKPFSRECDYMENCDYKCDFVGDFVHEDIYDTYNLYFANEEIQTIKRHISEFFLNKFAYDFNEIYIRLQYAMNKTVPPIILSRTLNEMINTNVPIYNQYGFLNYLREDKNMYFLVDNTFTSTTFTSYYYAKHPKPDSSFSNFNDVLSIYKSNGIDKIIGLIETYKTNENRLNRIFDFLDDEIKIFFIQNAIISFIEKQQDNIELVNYIMKRYKEYIKKLDDGSYIIDLEIKRKLPANYKDLPEEQRWYDLEETEIEKLKELKQDKLSKLQKNKFGYYGVIGNAFVGEEEYKNLNIVKIREKRLTAEGEIDTRVEQAEGGTACGTGEFSGNKIAILLYDLLVKSLEEGIEPPEIDIVIKKTDDIENKYKKHLKEHIELCMLIKLITQYCIDEYVNKDKVKELLKLFGTFKLEKIKQNKLDYLLSRKYSFIKLDDQQNINTNIKRVISFLLQNNIDIIGKLKLDKNIYQQMSEEMAEQEFETHKNYISKILVAKSKTSCSATKDWFIQNDLYIEKQV